MPRKGCCRIAVFSEKRDGYNLLRPSFVLAQPLLATLQIYCQTVLYSINLNGPLRPLT